MKTIPKALRRKILTEFKNAQRKYDQDYICLVSPTFRDLWAGSAFREMVREDARQFLEENPGSGATVGASEKSHPGLFYYVDWGSFESRRNVRLAFLAWWRNYDRNVVSLQVRRKIRKEFKERPDEFICHASDTFRALWGRRTEHNKLIVLAQQFLTEKKYPEDYHPVADDACLFYPNTPAEQEPMKREFIEWWCQLP